MQATSIDPVRPSPRRRRLCGATLAFLLCFCFVPAGAQEPEPEPEPETEPAGEARLSGTGILEVEGRTPSALPLTVTSAGPRFALAPIAAALGVELRIGPLGDSHALMMETQQILIGPGQSMAVILPRDGGEQDVMPLSVAPMKDAQGLKVPLDFLRIAFSDPLNVDFTWHDNEHRLEIRRRLLRSLRAAVAVVHQHRLTTVEISFSETPRYRVERPPGAIEIRLVDNRLEMPVHVPRERDPLVSRIVTAPEGVRLELGAGATAAEPRLLPGARLVIEVFEQAAQPQRQRDPDEERKPRRAGVDTIVLDPGHGGAETGAVGPSGTTEKALTLQVARALQQELERRLPVKVILTRDEDVETRLDARTAVANQNRADLFISLHFNSSFGTRAQGAETYFLSREASDRLAAELAAEENRFAGAASSSEQDLQIILWDLAQSHHLAESQRFATLVQEELNVALGLRDRGVKQAPFRVLMGAKMPAVLVELGFLSNPEEEAKLRLPAYRAELVDALVRAVTRFKRQVEAEADQPAEDAP